jgi:hypothetical protein
MRYFSTVLITIGVLLMISCSDELSRSKAKEEIIKHNELPIPVTVELKKRFLFDHQYLPGFRKVCLNFNFDRFSNWEGKLNKMESLGFITLQKDEFYDECDDLYMNVILTEKGKKFLENENEEDYEIRFYELVFGEITGIVSFEEFSGADVHYTLKKDNFTDFGMLIEGVTEIKEENKEIKKLENFSKYDDGWRLGR